MIRLTLDAVKQLRTSRLRESYRLEGRGMGMRPRGASNSTPGTP